MNAPKKIWASDMGGWFENESSHDTPYIRADLVDGLVQALVSVLNHTSIICEGNYGPEMDDAYDNARAALKAL